MACDRQGTILNAEDAIATKSASDLSLSIHPEARSTAEHAAKDATRDHENQEDCGAPLKQIDELLFHAASVVKLGVENFAAAVPLEKRQCAQVLVDSAPAVFWRIYGPLANIAYVVGGIFVFERVFWYFWQWELPLWKWVVAIMVVPITSIAMPIYIGFTEGDWSMVAAWVGACMIAFPLLWHKHYGGQGG